MHKVPFTLNYFIKEWEYKVCTYLDLDGVGSLEASKIV